MCQMSLQNQNVLLTRIEFLQIYVHLRDVIYMLMENQKVFVLPFHFSTSTSSGKAEQFPQTPPDSNLPTVGLHFSPVPL